MKSHQSAIQHDNSDSQLCGPSLPSLVLNYASPRRETSYSPGRNSSKQQSSGSLREPVFLTPVKIGQLKNTVQLKMQPPYQLPLEIDLELTKWIQTWIHRQATLRNLETNIASLLEVNLNDVYHNMPLEHQRFQGKLLSSETTSFWFSICCCVFAGNYASCNCSWPPLEAFWCSTLVVPSPLV